MHHRLRALLFSLALAVGAGACGGGSDDPCMSDRDCSSAGRVCDVSRAVCVQCLGDTDCLGADEVCRANACVEVTPCVTSRECPGLVCDVGRGFCVECVGDVDCPGEERCDADGVCQAPATPCASDRECSAMGQVCDTGAGECVECVRDADCVEGFTCQARECRSGPPSPDAGTDAGPRDSGMLDSSTGDAGTSDAGGADGGSADGGVGIDGGMDAGTDAGADAGTDAGTDAGGCASPCECAAATGSATGCSYWPVVTPNSNLYAEFSFAVFISNPGAVSASVTVTAGSGGAAVGSTTVPAGGSVALPLPRIATLDFSADASSSVRVDGGAYHLVSTVPVAVSQANPAEARLTTDCAAEGGTPDGECFAFTADASRLLPEHLLGTAYTVVSRPTQMLEITTSDFFGTTTTFSGTSGFATLVAVEPAVVQLRSSAFVNASTDGRVTALSPGATTSFTLAAGDVVTLATVQAETCPAGAPFDESGTAGVDLLRYRYCLQTPSYDLSGTSITSSGRLQVIGGHDCAFVPHDRWACDHLETSMLPTPRLGTRYVVARTPPFSDEPNVVRIVSPTANTLSFVPALVSPVALAAGGIYELEVRADVQVSGTAPFALVQHLVGEDFDGFGTMSGSGDPSAAALLPVTELATERAFHAPATFTNGVRLVAPVSGTVSLDGAAVTTGWVTVPGTSYRTTTVSVGAGFHRLVASAGVGGVSYGFATYVSYLSPL